MTENSTTRPTVLFVDDEASILRSLTRLFFDEPIDIVVAESGRDGLEVLKGKDAAVIVSDQRMPGMSGAEFLQRARDLSPDSVRIVLTGYADTASAIDAINKGGAHRYMSKPWSDIELTAAVRDGVERFRLIRENRYLTELTKRQNEELKIWNSELEMDVQQQTVDLTRQNQELSRLNQRLTGNLEAFINSFSNLLEHRSSGVGSHSYAVQTLSEHICRTLGIEGQEMQNIVRAARLHDMGKIGIPDIILFKDPEEMTSDETEEYRKHPVRGQAALDSVEELRHAGLLIRHHHENWDGTGFPDGIKEEAIPVGAQIIAVANRFDRMANGIQRLPTDKTLQEIRALLGTAFNPALFPALVVAVQNNVALFQGQIDVAELSPKDLRAGMVIARDLRTGTGILLLSKGMSLTEDNIEAVRRCYYLDPLKSGVFVRANKE